MGWLCHRPLIGLSILCIQRFFYYWLLWCSLEPSLYAAHNAEVLVLVNKSFHCNCLLCFSEFLMGPNFVCILMICLLGESLIGVG